MTIKSTGYGGRIAELIKEAGLNVNKFAVKIGEKPPTIWNYIKEKREPNSFILEKIATGLNSTVEYILKGNGSPNIVPMRRRTDTDGELAEVIKKVSDIWGWIKDIPERKSAAMGLLDLYYDGLKPEAKRKHPTKS